MTAINNHVLAITLASFWLWLAVRLVKRGPQWVDLLLLTAITVLAFFTQLAGLVLVGFYPLVLLLTFMRRRRWILLPAMGLLAILLLSFSLRLDLPAYWLPQMRQEISLQCSIPPLADNVQATPILSGLQLQSRPDTEWGVDDRAWHSGVFQNIPSAQAANLFGNTVVVGAWVWADQSVQVYGPGLNVFYGGSDHWYGFPTVKAGPQPVFIATQVRLPEKPGNLQVWLRATTPYESSARLCFSGVILAQGSYPLQKPPRFDDPGAAQGQWGKQTVHNLVRNPFFLQTWPAPGPWIKLLQQQNSFSISSLAFPSIFSILLDSSARWFPINSSMYLLRSFWDSYAWGGQRLVSIPGILYHPYRLTSGLILVCTVGFVLYLIRRRKELPWAVLLLLAAVTLVVIGIAYLYGLLTMGGALRFRAHYPSARFIYSVILPLSFMLCAGWLGLAERLPLVKKHLHLASLLLAGFLLLFAVYSWYSLGVQLSIF